MELKQYENSVIETDEVLKRISSLLKSGESFSEIAVTVSDDETADLFISKAKLLDLKMNLRGGKPLSEYPAGRLPGLLRACKIGGYSLATVKKLLLDRAFVWKEAETASALVRFGIENRCIRNFSPAPSGDVWVQRLKSYRRNSSEGSVSKQDLLGFYRKLRASVDAICSAKSFQQLSREFQIFISSFLETGTEEWDSECEQVFQRTREVLSSLRDTDEQLENITVSDPMGFWIDSLKGKIYVRQHAEAGIAVYPYRVSALINPGHHFIIGLSNEAASAVSRDLTFLSDQQRQEVGASENNMTDDFIKIYSGSGSNVYFSCSSDTPSGAALPPGYFIEQDRICRTGSSDFTDMYSADPVRAEALWWERACTAGPRIREAGALPELAKIQLEGFKYAYATLMTEKGFDASEAAFPVDFSTDNLIPELSDKKTGFFRITATSLNGWSVCPFSLLLGNVFGIPDEDYVLRAEDPWTAGSVMHDILHDFFFRYP